MTKLGDPSNTCNIINFLQLVAQQMLEYVASCDCLLPLFPPKRATHFHVAESRRRFYLILPGRIIYRQVPQFSLAASVASHVAKLPPVTARHVKLPNWTFCTVLYRKYKFSVVKADVTVYNNNNLVNHR